MSEDIQATIIALPASARLNDDGSVTVKLRRAIKSENEEVAELTVREPRAPEMRMLDGKGQVAGKQAMLRACSGLAPSSFDQISGADLVTLDVVLAYFLAPGLPTGENVSPRLPTS